MPSMVASKVGCPAMRDEEGQLKEVFEDEVSCNVRPFLNPLSVSPFILSCEGYSYWPLTRVKVPDNQPETQPHRTSQMASSPQVVRW